jgi:hypothetical protein
MNLVLIGGVVVVVVAAVSSISLTACWRLVNELRLLVGLRRSSEFSSMVAPELPSSWYRLKSPLRLAIRLGFEVSLCDSLSRLRFEGLPLIAPRPC